MSTSVATGTVVAEGADIYFERRGTGPALPRWTPWRTADSRVRCLFAQEARDLLGDELGRGHDRRVPLAAQQGDPCIGTDANPGAGS
jgi:hypothetical protein